MTITKPCKCTHDFQDHIYGKKMRLHNISENGKRAKCTVCNSSINLDSSSKK